MTVIDSDVTSDNMVEEAGSNEMPHIGHVDEVDNVDRLEAFATSTAAALGGCGVEVDGTKDEAGRVGCRRRNLPSLCSSTPKY